MQIPEFDETKMTDEDGYYIYDGGKYAVQDGNVFVCKDDVFTFTEEFTTEQLEMYGEKQEDFSGRFELKVLEITERDDGSAFIKATDNAGLDLTFVDPNYFEHSENYAVEKIGTYRLFATVTESEFPENFKEGLELSGEDAKKWFDWMGEEVEENARAVIHSNDFACYSESENFAETTLYDFRVLVDTPSIVALDEPGNEEFSDGFHLVMMNQFNRQISRYVLCDFKSGHFPKRFYENRKEDEDFDFMEGGFVLQGKVYFQAVFYDRPEDKDKGALYKFDSNPFVPCEAKGYYSFDDEDYIENENGERMLDPEKAGKYFDDEDEEESDPRFGGDFCDFFGDD